MNDSGLAVRKVLAREHAPLTDLLVVADDFALPFGKLRFREGGGHGGHNGLRSIIDELGTEKFSRLRVGIGDPVTRRRRPRPLDVPTRRDGAARRAARRHRRRDRGLGARGDEQGGQPLQHVRAPPGGHCPPRRAGRGRRAGGCRRHPANAHGLAAHPARPVGGLSRCRPHRSADGAAATAVSPSGSPPTSPRVTLDRPAETLDFDVAAVDARGRGRGARRSDGGRQHGPEPQARQPRADGRTRPGSGHRLPDLSALPPLLARDRHLRGAARAARRQRPARAGTGRRTIATCRTPRRPRLDPARREELPGRGARARRRTASDSSGSRGTRRSATAWRRSSARGSGDPAAVVTLEPRTALAYERSELVADETAARVATLAAWRGGRARVLVAGVQALLQHTISPADLPDAAREAAARGADPPGRAAARPVRPRLRAGPRSRRARRVRPSRRDRRCLPAVAAAAHPDRVLRRRDRLAPRVRPDRSADRRPGRGGEPPARLGVPAPARRCGGDRRAPWSRGRLGCPSGSPPTSFASEPNQPMRRDTRQRPGPCPSAMPPKSGRPTWRPPPGSTTSRRKRCS